MDRIGIFILSRFIDLILPALLLVFVVSSPVYAADGINRQIPYFGILKSSDGSVVSDGVYDMVFRIYDGTDTVLWTGRYDVENGNPVQVRGGISK